MSDVDTAINGFRLAIAAAEAISHAMGKAKSDLDSHTDQLKTLLAGIEKDQQSMHEALERDRKEESDAFDKKFDPPDGGDKP